MKLSCGSCARPGATRTLAELRDDGQPIRRIRFDLDNPDWQGHLARPSRPQVLVRREGEDGWRISCKCRATFVLTDEELARAAQRGATDLLAGVTVGRRVS